MLPYFEIKLYYTIHLNCIPFSIVFIFYSTIILHGSALHYDCRQLFYNRNAGLNSNLKKIMRTHSHTNDNRFDNNHKEFVGRSRIFIQLSSGSFTVKSNNLLLFLNLKYTYNIFNQNNDLLKNTTPFFSYQFLIF